MRRWRLRDQPVGRSRVIRATLAYALVLLFLVALGLSPSPVLLAAFFVVGAAVAAYFSDRFLGSQGETWVNAGQSTMGLGRGSDHRTVALAHRLAARSREPGQSEHLAGELQRQLQAVLADRVRRERGVDVLAHPEIAYDVLPSDLADLVTKPPDRRLTDAAYLSSLLDRIESS